ncbi:MAG: ATP-grasp domain-containing protein [Lentisphaerae bacterium]|nr:ATP-grasp domain-containing protein [Lentisphaerota bacterium]
MTRVLIAYSARRIYYDREHKPQLDCNILGTALEVEQALLTAGFVVKRAGISRNPAPFIRELRKFRPHAVFNLCEDVGGDTTKERAVAALFELLNVRFTGNGVLPLSICLNKAFTKRILKTAAVPTPPFAVMDNEDDIDLPFSFPAMVKPIREDGSVGITARSFVTNHKRLADRIRYIRTNFRQPAIVEKYVAGREFQVSLLGNRQPTILAIVELSYKGLPRSLPRICTYSAKWTTNSRYYRHTIPIIPARINEKLEKRISEIARKIFDVFHLRGYARVDFRVARNKPFVIDINPNPDISPDAGFARAAQWAGLPYPDLAKRLVELAMEQP